MKIVVKKIKDSDFIKLSKIPLKKSRGFRAAYSAEMNRLALVHAVRLLRKKKRMTQKEVADKAQMPQSVIARIESGEHNFSAATLYRIAAVFDKHIGLVD